MGAEISVAMLQPGMVATSEKPEDQPSIPATRHAHRSSAWTRDRCAWLGYLVGCGWDAKRIAKDPLIHSTPGAVQRQALRLGLSLGYAPAVLTSVRLPPATGAFYDRLASIHGLTRDAAIRRAMIMLANEPGAIERLSV